MPTSFTERVTDSMSLEDFAILCTRGLSITVHMRDIPLDAPMPEKFSPPPHTQNELFNNQCELRRFSELNSAELQTDYKTYQTIKMQEKARVLGSIRIKRNAFERLNVMVEKWEPPTDDHKYLKKFMLEQLHGGITHDCDDSYYHRSDYMLSFDEWKSDRLSSLLNANDNMNVRWARELDKAEKLTVWFRQLRESLKGT